MSTYNVCIQFAQRVEIASRFLSAQCEQFPDGTTNVTLADDEVDAFVAWCDENAIDAELI